MSAPECRRCDGWGEVWTGRDEHETGAPITAICPECAGSGSERAA